MFSKFSATYPKPESNVEHFEQKDDPERYVFSKLETAKDAIS